MHRQRFRHCDPRLPRAEAALEGRHIQGLPLPRALAQSPHHLRGRTGAAGRPGRHRRLPGNGVLRHALDVFHRPVGQRAHLRGEMGPRRPCVRGRGRGGHTIPVGRQRTRSPDKPRHVPRAQRKQRGLHMRTRRLEHPRPGVRCEWAHGGRARRGSRPRRHRHRRRGWHREAVGRGNFGRQGHLRTRMGPRQFHCSQQKKLPCRRSRLHFGAYPRPGHSYIRDNHAAHPPPAMHSVGKRAVD